MVLGQNGVIRVRRFSGKFCSAVLLAAILGCFITLSFFLRIVVLQMATGSHDESDDEGSDLESVESFNAAGATGAGTETCALIAFEFSFVLLVCGDD